MVVTVCVCVLHYSLLYQEKTQRPTLDQAREYSTLQLKTPPTPPGPRERGEEGRRSLRLCCRALV